MAKELKSGWALPMVLSKRMYAWNGWHNLSVYVDSKPVPQQVKKHYHFTITNFEATKADEAIRQIVGFAQSAMARHQEEKKKKVKTQPGGKSPSNQPSTPKESVNSRGQPAQVNKPGDRPAAAKQKTAAPAGQSAGPEQPANKAVNLKDDIKAGMSKKSVKRVLNALADGKLTITGKESQILKEAMSGIANTGGFDGWLGVSDPQLAAKRSTVLHKLGYQVLKPLDPPVFVRQGGQVRA
jgi:hypothetical protein